MFSLGALSLVTLLIIALITGISLYAFQNRRLLDDWMLDPSAIKRGTKYYTFVTAGLVHADMGHLFFNMLTLYFFGMSLENVYEGYLGLPGVMVGILFFSGVVVGNLASYLLHRDRRNYRTLGASGGVESVVFASILLSPSGSICLYFALCIPAFLYGIGYLAYSYFQGRRGMDNTNHDAHLAGAIYGLIWQTVWTPHAWGEVLPQIMGN